MERLRRLLYNLLIVPGAHTRVFDADFQLEVYEVFHTHPLTRWGHLICTPIVNIALLAAASRLPMPSLHFAGWLIDGAVVAAGITMVGYFAVHGAWAAFMIPVLFAAIAFERWLAALYGPWTLQGSLEIAALAAFVQTFSHSFEPIPPPWSGTYGWISLRKFILRTPLVKLACATFAFIAVYPWLEFWASPRIWPVQMTHLMMRAGLRPSLAGPMRARVRAIFADARNGWTLPPLGAEADSD